MTSKKNLKLAARIIERYGTQLDFADAVGMKPPLVNRIINGRRDVSKQEASVFAKALKCRVKDIFA